MIPIVFVPKYLILQLAGSRRAPAVEKNPKCKRAAIRSRQRPGSVPALKKSCIQCTEKGFFFFPRNGFEAQALGVETNQPPSALNAPPFLVSQARGASSDFFSPFAHWVRANPKPLQPTGSKRIRAKNCHASAGPIQSRATIAVPALCFQLRRNYA